MIEVTLLAHSSVNTEILTAVANANDGVYPLTLSAIKGYWSFRSTLYPELMKYMGFSADKETMEISENGKVCLILKWT